MLAKHISEILHAAGLKAGIRQMKHYSGRRYQLPAPSGYKLAPQGDGSCRISIHLDFNDSNSTDKREKLLDDISEALEKAGVPYDDEGETILCFEE